MVVCLSFLNVNAEADKNLVPTNLKKLTTEGKNFIEAESGKVIILRGINFTGGVWAFPGITDPGIVKFMTSEWDFKTVKSWGVNVITFYMDYAWFATEKGFKHMEEIFGWCRKYDIYIIPHINVCPGGENRGGAVFFKSEKNKQKLLEFWVEFAKRYKDREEIAGYCFIDEPHAVGADIRWEEMPRIIKQYTERVIDAVRAVDKVTPIHVQTVYGDPYASFDIDHGKKGIVYNYHFYLPMGYTAAGYTWIGNAGIPLDVRYPGEYVTKVEHTSDSVHTVDFPIDIGGTQGGWRMVEVSARVPRDGVNAAFLELYCNGDKNAVIYFDDFSYNTDDGSRFHGVACGSFEAPDDWNASVPLVWIKHDNNGRNGSGIRTTEAAHHGGYSLKLSNCSGLTFYENTDYWFSSAGAIQVTGGQTLTIRYWLKLKNATPGANGIRIKWAVIKKDYLNKTKLQSLIKETVIKRRNASNRPVFIGEFSPSLASIRPDNLHYLQDELEYFNRNNLSWTFYSYRSPYTNPDRLFLGVIYARDGLTTDKYWHIDNEVLDVLKRYY
jgi:hypothetical protein